MKNKPTVQLIGRDGNVFSIMASVERAFKDFYEKDEAKKKFQEYQEKVFSGDYDNAIKTTMEYCDVY